MKAMKYWIAMIVCLAGTAAHAALPVVTNVVATQRADTKLVDIHYDVFDDDGDLLKIRVEISDNAGNTYSVPAFSFTGDIGENIEPGAGKHIVWDAGTDWDGEYSDLMRVKVIAVDGQGLPGLAWGSEVPPGGFLMGQDGGAEGSGPSRHINIPWSYWLSKYEIRNDQYCDFINIVLVAGDVYRVGTSEVRAEVGRFPGVPGGVTLLYIGDNKDIRWNVNNFEVVNNRTNFPVRVTWYGAMAFAQHYGYDLPTEAEWEKAARGPNNWGSDDHLAYIWGNEIHGGHANYRSSSHPYRSLGGTTPVGYYNGNQTPFGPDMANVFGLYDMTGNVDEWIRTTWLSTIEQYPQQESIASQHNQISTIAHRVLRGGHWNSWASEVMIYRRVQGANLSSDSSTTGFRVARRQIEYRDPTPSATISENFDGPEWTPRGSASAGWVVTAESGEWTATSRVYLESNPENAYSGEQHIRLGDINTSAGAALSLPNAPDIPVGIAAWVRAASSDRHGWIYYQESDGTTWRTMETAQISGIEYRKIRMNTELVTAESGKSYRILGNYGVYLDNIEVYTVPQP